MWKWIHKLVGASSSKNADHERGRLGEAAAARLLQESGFRIIERNWRCPLGEIDLIAQRADVIAIVEVKTSLRRGSIPPELRVNSRKQHKLRMVAAYYLKHRRPQGSLRFDVIAVWWDGGGRIQFQHIENAF
jgi:putative endonuclease